MHYTHGVRSSMCVQLVVLVFSAGVACAGREAASNDGDDSGLSADSTIGDATHDSSPSIDARLETHDAFDARDVAEVEDGSGATLCGGGTTLALSAESSYASATYAEQGGVVVASDGTSYLLVWAEGSYPSRILATRVDASGAALDHPALLLVDDGNAPVPTTVGFDGTDFVVVSAQTYSAPSSPPAYLTRVSPSGVVRASPGSPLSVTTGILSVPTLQCVSTGCLVAWVVGTTTSADVYASRLVAGALLDMPGIRLGTTSASDRVPTVDHDGSSWLVEFESLDSTHHFLGDWARIDGTGAVIGTGPPIVPDAVRAALAFDGVNHLMVYEAEVTGGYIKLFATRVSVDGVALDTPFVLTDSGLYASVVWDGTDFVASWWYGPEVGLTRITSSATADTTPIRITDGTHDVYDVSPQLATDGRGHGLVAYERCAYSEGGASECSVRWRMVTNCDAK
jgi:hypothetical protein